jgi:hypothetical protein
MKLINPKLQRLLLFVPVLLMLFVSGCASSSGGASAPGGGRSLKDVDLDVTPKMTKYHNAVARGELTQGEQEQINNAYARYQAAYNEALQAANNNRNAPAPSNVEALATQVISALGQAAP